MTSKQIEREIANLETSGTLSSGAARRLRQLKQALPNVQSDEAKRKQTKDRLKAYGDTTPAQTSQPVDKGLDGSAWASFFTRYCDPKGLSRIPKESAPATRPVREPKVKTDSPVLSLNGRSIVLTVDIPAKKVLRVGPAVIEKPFVTQPISRKEAREWESRRTSTRRESSNCLPGWTFGLSKALEFIANADKLVQVYGPKRAARLERKLPAIRATVEQVQATA